MRILPSQGLGGFFCIVGFTLSFPEGFKCKRWGAVSPPGVPRQRGARPWLWGCHSQSPFFPQLSWNWIFLHLNSVVPWKKTCAQCRAPLLGLPHCPMPLHWER